MSILLDTVPASDGQRTELVQQYRAVHVLHVDARQISKSNIKRCQSKIIIKYPIKNMVWFCT